jgi:hypothetical protein
MVFGVVPGPVFESYGSEEAFLEANPLPIKPTKTRMPLASWLASTAVAIRTNEQGLVRISRATIVQYLANRKGGVHFDPHRKLALANKRKRRKEVEYFLLDHGLLRVGHLSGPEFEVASLVQSVQAADWTTEIIAAAKGMAPEDFRGDPNEIKLWTGLKEADGTGWASFRFNVASSDPEGDGG